jgi:hypothetical protein
MRKVDTNVKELVGMIERGELRLPEMQRRYVWRAPRVRDLLDSLYRKYPSGTVLVWETDQEQPSRDLAVTQNTSPFSGHKLLLDGQQRLTSLSAVLRGQPIKARGRKREIDILFNLEHPDKCQEFTEVVEDQESPLVSDDELTENELEEEEDEEIDLAERMKRMTFVVSNNRLLQQPNWVSVAKVFKSSSDTEILKHAGVTSFDDPRYAKYSTRLQKLRAIENYPYTMQVLSRDLSYEEVAEIFVRVNSLGVKLRGSDLALAQITAKWPNSLKLLEEFQDECERGWMTLDLGLLVRAMVVFTTGQARFDRVSSLAVKKLQDGWEKAKDGLRFACNFLRTNADIEDESLLSSPLFFIVIAYYSQIKKENFSQDEVKRLLYWLYIANARGRYSRGSTETLLDGDLNTITKGGGAIELIETVRQQFGRLNLEPTDFIGRGAGSPLFSLVFLALKAQGAKDWNTGLGLSLTHQGRYHYIQYHHIFPKSLLKGEYETREINEIANMAFISGKTNRKISDKEPSVYLPRVIKENGSETLKLQGVPLDQSLYQIDRYKEFLHERRAILNNTANDFLQSILE